MKSNRVYDIFSKRKIFFAIPIIIAVLTIIFTFVLGLEVDIEFKGGTLLTYSYSGEVNTDEIKSTVDSLGYGLVNVTAGSSLSSSLETITVSFASNDSLTADVQQIVTDTLQEQFVDNALVLEKSQDVNPTTGATFFVKCLVAVLFSFVLLVIYIGCRFKKIGGISAGIFSLVALLQDVFMVYASFVFFRLPVDANFMAVILTILGYSINSTIVMYDRVRENRTIYGKKMGLIELVNTSISQTLTRTINTNITTVSAVLIICIVAFVCGVESIISFAFPMIVGILAGAFSSTFIAGPLWVIWQQYKQKRNSGVSSK